MKDLYLALIFKHRRTLARVPAEYQDAVREDLRALGLDDAGYPVEEE